MIRTPILLYVTVKNRQEAIAIAKTLLEEKLVACVNITSQMTSLYEWEGKTQQQTEVAMLLKTAEEMQDRVIQRIASLHPNACPCILALPITAAYKPFAQWVDTQVIEKNCD